MMELKSGRRTFLKSCAQGLPLLGTSYRLQLSRAMAALDLSGDPTQNRTLIFDESFQRIDGRIWNGGPKAWTGPSGFYGRSAFAPLSGAEGFIPYQIVPDPEATGGSALQISAKYIGHNMAINNYYGNTLPEYQWVSGNLQTGSRNGSVSKGWAQGYFEARMKFPAHPLTWPAFWLLNQNGITDQKRSIEIDIVEHKGFEPKLYGAYLHEWGQPDEHHEGTGVPTLADLTKGYYRYGILIKNGQCIPYFERKPIINLQTKKLNIWTIARSEEMQRNRDVFWPLLTLALRTDVPYPNLTEEQKITHMRVDYFRLYE